MAAVYANNPKQISQDSSQIPGNVRTIVLICGMRIPAAVLLTLLIKNNVLLLVIASCLMIRPVEWDLTPVNQEVAAGGLVVSGRGQQSVSEQPPAKFSQDKKTGQPQVCFPT